MTKVRSFVVACMCLLGNILLACRENAPHLLLCWHAAWTWRLVKTVVQEPCAMRDVEEYRVALGRIPLEQHLLQTERPLVLRRDP